jgi:L-rhamnose mutarotase
VSAAGKILSIAEDAGSAASADLLPNAAAERPSAGLTRKAFVLKLRPGCAAEYHRRHNPIWPELEEIFRQHGVRRYSIFLCEETHQLFACIDIEDATRWNSVAQTPAMCRWRQHMSDLLEYDTMGRPVVKPLREVFNLG